MSTENDTLAGGGELSLDDAASAYAKATSPAADEGQAEEEELDTGDTAEDEPELESEGEEEGEAEDEGQADEEETDDEPESDQGRFVAANGKVRLPDGTIATVNDLIQGNLRDRDYRQKTMSLADEKRTVETQSSALKQQEQQLSEQRALMTQMLTSIMPQAPDPALAHTSPSEYVAAKAVYDQYLGYIQHLEQHDAQSRQAREAEIAKARQEKGNAEWATLVEKVPALAEPKRFEKFVGDIKTIGTSYYGFTEKEMADALGYDHRQALVMRDAIAWRKLQDSKPKAQSKTEGRPPIQKSGKRLAPDAQRARSATVAMDRLKESGSVNDAVAAYLAQQKG
jgi:hypothetical protein